MSNKWFSVGVIWIIQFDRSLVMIICSSLQKTPWKQTWIKGIVIDGIIILINLYSVANFRRDHSPHDGLWVSFVSHSSPCTFFFFISIRTFLFIFNCNFKMATKIRSRMKSKKKSFNFLWIFSWLLLLSTFLEEKC